MDVVHGLAGAVIVPVFEKVLHPQLQWVHLELVEEVHGALPRPGGLHLAVAEGAVGRKVGVDGARVDPNVGDAVRPRAAKPIFWATPGPQSA